MAIADIHIFTISTHSINKINSRADSFSSLSQSPGRQDMDMSLARLHVQFQLGYDRETSGELVAIVALVAISLCPWSSGALLQLGQG